MLALTEAPPALGGWEPWAQSPRQPPDSLFVNSALQTSPLPTSRPPSSGQYLHNLASSCYDWLSAPSLLGMGGTFEERRQCHSSEVISIVPPPSAALGSSADWAGGGLRGGAGRLKWLARAVSLRGCWPHFRLGVSGSRGPAGRGGQRG